MNQDGSTEKWDEVSPEDCERQEFRVLFRTDAPRIWTHPVPMPIIAAEAIRLGIGRDEVESRLWLEVPDIPLGRAYQRFVELLRTRSIMDVMVSKCDDFETAGSWCPERLHEFHRSMALSGRPFHFVWTFRAYQYNDR